MSEDLKDKVVFGGLYEVEHGFWANQRGGSLNDQHYDLAVPLVDSKGNLWMKDTYEMKFWCPKLEEGQSKVEYVIDRLTKAKEGDDYIVRNEDFYYDNKYQIHSEEDLKHFKLLGDLNNFRQVKRDEDPRDYREEDKIYHVKLWWEHGYSWNYGSIGITMIRKGAKKIEAFRFENKVNDFYRQLTFPDSSTYQFNELNSMYEEMQEKGVKLDPKVENKYLQCFFLHSRLLGMKEEINKYLKDSKYRFKFDMFDSSNKFGDIPNIEEYLAERCYCPNEVYSLDRFGYMLYYKEDPCKIIAKSTEDDETIVAIVIPNKNPSMNKAQIMVIDYKKGQGFKSEDPFIEDILRIDITENNIKCIDKIIKQEKVHLDTYAREDTESIVNDRINFFDEISL